MTMLKSREINMRIQVARQVNAVSWLRQFSIKHFRFFKYNWNLLLGTMGIAACCYQRSDSSHPSASVRVNCVLIHPYIILYCLWPKYGWHGSSWYLSITLLSCGKRQVKWQYMSCGCWTTYRTYANKEITFCRPTDTL